MAPLASSRASTRRRWPELRDDVHIRDTLFTIALVGILLIDALNTLIDDKTLGAESHHLSRLYLQLTGHSPSEELDRNAPEALE
jgi:hypothetical protein